MKIVEITTSDVRAMFRYKKERLLPSISAVTPCFAGIFNRSSNLPSHCEPFPACHCEEPQATRQSDEVVARAKPVAIPSYNSLSPGGRELE